MPPPIRVELVSHNPLWAEWAAAEKASLWRLLGRNLIDVHHIGSTAIPGICAKPILDLIPVVESLARFEESRSKLENAGFALWGEVGLTGRCYCTRDDATTGRRLVQLHVFERGSKHIERHLAFRDHLRQDRSATELYEREKKRCQALHPDDSHAYTECKSGHIKALEAEAIGCPTR